MKCSRTDAEKYSAEEIFAVENVSVFQIICNILQDASKFQYGIQLHIYSIERHLKFFIEKKSKDHTKSQVQSADSFSHRWKG